MNDISFLENYINVDYIFIEPPFAKRHVVKGYNVLPFYCDSISCKFFRDQTRLFCPHGCYCEYENQKMRLELNCTVPEVKTELRFELDIGSATLYMINTNATRLPNASVYSYYSITNLQVANNKLDELNIYHLPPNLTILDIRNNSLKLLNQEIIDYISHRNGSLHIKLSSNPWNCDCRPPRFLKFMAKYNKMIDDYDFVDCNGIRPVLKLDDCRLNTTYLILSLAFLLVFVSVFACSIIFWFKMSILMWLYDHNIFMSCILRTADNIEFHKKFDGFLAFSHKNLDLVTEYVEQLENGQREFKLCFYHRDWLIGESIPECILQSIDDSKRIILLMTKEFLESSWGTFEFRTAIKATSMDRHKRLIVIVYPEVENFDNLDTELRLYMKYNTYLSRDDSQFWRKLIFAMPHKKAKSSKKMPKLKQEAEV